MSMTPNRKSFKPGKALSGGGMAILLPLLAASVSSSAQGAQTAHTAEKKSPGIPFEFVLERSEAQPDSATVELMYPEPPGDGRWISDVMVYWVTPSGEAMTLPLPPVVEGLFAAQVQGPFEHGVHHLMISLILRDAEGFVDRVMERRYRIDGETLANAGGEYRVITADFSEKRSGNAYVNDNSPKRSPLIGALIGSVIALLLGFAIATAYLFKTGRTRLLGSMAEQALRTLGQSPAGRFVPVLRRYAREEPHVSFATFIRGPAAPAAPAADKSTAKTPEAADETDADPEDAKEETAKILADSLNTQIEQAEGGTEEEEPTPEVDQSESSDQTEESEPAEPESSAGGCGPQEEEPAGERALKQMDF